MFIIKPLEVDDGVADLADLGDEEVAEWLRLRRVPVKEARTWLEPSGRMNCSRSSVFVRPFAL